MEVGILRHKMLKTEEIYTKEEEENEVKNISLSYSINRRNETKH